MIINAVSEFRDALKQGKYAWPGGYPWYFVCADGEALSYEAAEANKHMVEAAISHQDRCGGWCVVAREVNWEDTDLLCSHTNKPIESAYGGN